MSNTATKASVSFDAICQWLIAKIANELNVPEGQIKITEEFANLGLGSRQAILITGELEEFLECDELDPSLLWDYPTIEKLARHLSA